jgi:branched-chain amino acid transport system ATP-binding protein
MDQYFNVSRIHKSFGGVRAVNDVSFELVRGQPTSLIGANGAGKTTLLDIMTGFTTADTGVILWRGRALTSKGPDAVARAGVARTFQDLRLFEGLSVAENVYTCMRELQGANGMIGTLISRRARRLPPQVIERTRELIEKVGLARRASVPARDLSYGERKMLALARVLAVDADLLLLDEPLAGLSSAYIGRTLDLARDALARGRTILMVDHNMEGVFEFAQRIIVLDHGTIIADTTPSEVVANELVKKAYLGA